MNKLCFVTTLLDSFWNTQQEDPNRPYLHNNPKTQEGNHDQGPKDHASNIYKGKIPMLRFMSI